MDVWHRRLGVRVRLKQYLRTADRDAGRGKRRVVNLPDCSIARCLCAIASRGARLVYTREKKHKSLVVVRAFRGQN